MRMIGWMMLTGLVLTFGCSSTNNAPHYAPPPGDDSTLAVLRCDGASMMEVDGLKTTDRHLVKLAPGTHQIRSEFTVHRGLMAAQGKWELNYNFEAGKKFHVDKEDSLFSFHEPRFRLIDDASGAQTMTAGGKGLFSFH
jgi:hypothetical protein